MKRALEYYVKPLFKALDETAMRYPDRIGFIEPQREEYSYGQIKRLSDSLCLILIKHGIKKGDRLIVFLPNCIEFVICFYGIQKSGAVVVPINVLSTDLELSKYISIVKPSGFITTWKLYETHPSLEKIEGFKEIINLKDLSFLNRLQQEGTGEVSIPEINVFEDLAVIPFSSGTTGEPKGVSLTHSNLYCNIQQVIDAHELQETDVFINHLPYFHIYGMNVLMGTAVYMGAIQVILKGFDPELLLDSVERYGGTLLFTVPTALNHLVKHCNLYNRNLRTLRFLNIGGGALNPEIGHEFSSLTGVTVNQAYGLTESSPTTHANPLSKIKHESIGLPVADTFIKIMDIDSLKEVTQGERGELWIKGPQIMKGYFENPEATKNTLIDGWLRTGDIAWVDEEGYTYIVDRLKELIKYKSYQVSPTELENILMEIEEVEDCAVVGRPDEDAGELPVAFVVPKHEGVKKEDIKEYMASRVAPYKKIRDVIFVSEIPKSGSGKILRRHLKERFIKETNLSL